MSTELRDNLRIILSQQSRDNSVKSKLLRSPWETMMKKFVNSKKEMCKVTSVENPQVHRPKMQFVTGSEYEGMWDLLGMSGHGVYTFSNGVKYEGEFYDGVFDGQGELRFSCGSILRGKWKEGQLIEKTLNFADGLVYKDADWNYCKKPDRRFAIEFKKGMQPAGGSFLTAKQPTIPLPPGYYDTCDGLYDPKTKIIYKPDDRAVIKALSHGEQAWITENCRSSPDTQVGPRIDLYEKWSEPEDKMKPSSSKFANLLTRSSDFTVSPCASDLHRKSTTRWNQRPLFHYKDFLE